MEFGHDKANIKNPYPMYEALRLVNPVYQAQTKEFIITGYQDVKSILKSQSFESGNKLDWPENYTSSANGNPFRGLSKNGNPLPSGTYFYTIEIPDKALISGYLTLKQ